MSKLEEDPSWLEELKALEKQIYEEIAEADNKRQEALARDIATYSDSIKFVEAMYVEYEGTLADRLDQFNDEMSFTEYLGLVDEPEGERQESDLGFEHEYVNQTCNGGYYGDEYSGYIYFPMPDKKYMKFYYSC